jgi:hypothetical protein
VCRSRRRAGCHALLALCALLASGAPGAAIELNAGGVRGRLTGALTGWQVFRLDSDTPRELPSGALDLNLDAVRGEHFRLFSSLRAGFDG